MTFGPAAIRGVGGGGVDYRFARRQVIDSYRAGRLAPHEVCDAHPELRRAAENCASPTEAECPICEKDKVVLVTYVFGPKLPAFGRCITSARELRQFAKTAGDFTAYVVEVCPGCAWNHLHHTFLLGRSA